MSIVVEFDPILGKLRNTDTSSGYLTVPSLTTGSVAVWASSNFTEDHANFYYSVTGHQLSVATNSDFTGTDAVNIYNQYDTYLPYSSITTGSASSPGISQSTSRGTGPSPSESLDTDPIGGPSWWPYLNGNWSETAAIRAYVQGSTTNNRGSRIDIVTKTDGGAEAVSMSLDNQQRTGIGVAYGSISARLHVQGSGHGTSATTYTQILQDSSGNELLATKDSGIHRILNGISGLTSWTGGLVQVLTSQGLPTYVTSSTWYSNPLLLIGASQGSIGIGTDSTLISAPSGSYGPALRLRNLSGVFAFDNNTINTGTASSVLVTSGSLSSNSEGATIFGGELRGFTRISCSVTGGSHFNNDFWSNTSTNEYRINTSNGAGALLTRFGIQSVAATVIAYFNNLSGLGINTTGPTSTLHVNGSLALNYVAKTGNYTLTANDYCVTATTSLITITLPTAVAITGRKYVIKNNSGGNITIATTSSQTIDGSAPGTLANLGILRLMSNGANWINI